ncbi:MAG: ATP-binding protein [Gammaproteobacteria bacterium]|nr:ATP-binding protein [Gammaproteobacteria bacterium]
MLLDTLLSQPRETLEICLRETAYGRSDRGDLVRDVMGLANLPGNESRYIVLGVQRDGDDVVPVGLDDAALAEVETYVDLIGQYLEPELSIGIHCNSLKGKIVAVIEVRSCDNPPYMVATDVSQELKTGACWIREPGLFRAARRCDLDRIFNARVPQSEVSEVESEPEQPVQAVLLGFNNDPAQLQWATRIPDLESVPSVIAAKRLQDQIKVVKAAGEQDFADSAIARLVHAQQYGAELPYDERGVNTLVEDYNSVSSEYDDADRYFYQETNALKLSLSIRNNGEEMLEQITVVLTLPVVEEFRVVDHLCPPPGSERSKHESDLLGYPEVTYRESAVQVRQVIDSLPPGAECPLFETALRIALRPEIAGKKIALRYTLHAQGLSKPEEGALKLLLKK